MDEKKDEGPYHQRFGNAICLPLMLNCTLHYSRAVPLPLMYRLSINHLKTLHVGFPKLFGSSRVYLSLVSIRSLLLRLLQWPTQSRRKKAEEGGSRSEEEEGARPEEEGTRSAFKETSHVGGKYGGGRLGRGRERERERERREGVYEGWKFGRGLILLLSF